LFSIFAKILLMRILQSSWIPPHLDSLGGVVLGASEDKALGDALAAQLVDLHHAAEGDQADHAVRRQQTERHLQKAAISFVFIYLFVYYEFQ
jgi:hypothetical protein